LGFGWSDVPGREKIKLLPYVAEVHLHSLAKFGCKQDMKVKKSLSILPIFGYQAKTQ
jgi:hypothetical protein